MNLLCGAEFSVRCRVGAYYARGSFKENTREFCRDIGNCL